MPLAHACPPFVNPRSFVTWTPRAAPRAILRQPPVTRQKIQIPPEPLRDRLWCTASDSRGPRPSQTAEYADPSQCSQANGGTASLSVACRLQECPTTFCVANPVDNLQACRTCFQATDQQFGELGFQVDVGHTSSSRAGRPGTSTPVGTPTTSPGALKAKKVPQNEEHGLVGHVEAAYTAHRSKEGRWGQTRRASESQGSTHAIRRLGINTVARNRIEAFWQDASRGCTTFATRQE